MNTANITRAEAKQRSAAISVHAYQIEIDLTGKTPSGEPIATPTQNFVAVTTVTFTSDGTPTWIDLIADEVLWAKLDGEELDAASFADDRFGLAPTPGEHRLELAALCRYSHTGEGLHRFVDPADDKVYLYTQFEPADARRMYACFEQPDLKATFQFTITAPHTWVVISNSASAQPNEQADGSSVWVFTQTPPISTYITALVAGEYYVQPGFVTSRKGKVPASLACRASMSQYLDADRLRQVTQRGFEVYEAAFDIAYPFDSYDQVFAPEYNAGAMENAGCVTIRDEFLPRSRVTQAFFEERDNVILHELAHMWFGDMVTMQWWDDLWLNESFAEWASHYAQTVISAKYGGIDPWVGFTNGRKTWAYRQDQLPTTHPVAADMVDLEAVEQNFDGITYAKGASVLKQLVAYVGEADFLRGVHAYFEANAWGNSQFADLLNALSEASGRDLSNFSADWLESCGVNTVRAEVTSNPEGQVSDFQVLQSAPDEFPVLRHHRMAIGCYTMVSGQLTQTDLFEVDIAGERTAVPSLIGKPRPDLILLNDRDMTYAKVRLDPTSLECALQQFGRIADPMARAVVYASLWDSWRDGELASGTYLDAVLRSLPAESDLTAVERRLGTLHVAATEYSHPDVRETNRRRLTSQLALLLRDAPPCSDYQVALADATIQAIDTTLGGKLVEGWLDGIEVPDGLTIDTDRRWAILKALARIGALDPTRLAAEVERDKTITGQESAAAVRSAWADADSKSWAWAMATGDATVPNETHRSIVTSFWQFGQEELLSDYRDKYLELCEQISARSGVWTGRGSQTIENTLIHLWPTPLADQEFLDQVSAWLDAHPDANYTVRHNLIENLDNSLRALRAQQSSLS